jgi:hypothetical protein
MTRAAKQVLKRAAVQTNSAAATAQLLQLESLSGPLDCFIDARKRFILSASGNAPAAPASKPSTSALAKGAKKTEDDAAAPVAKRPRPSSDTPDHTATAVACKEPRQAAAAAAAAAAGESDGLTLHVRHAFEIRELSLRKL